MERRFAVHAGSYRQALIAAIVLAATPALAAPKLARAKKEFDKGVAAYQKNDFAAASTAFGKSFTLENDAETLFAWAQAERKQNRCDRATELYAKLYAMDLPAENKAVIKGQIAECQAILDAQKPAPEPKSEPTPEPNPVPTPPTRPEPEVTAQPEVAKPPVVVDHPANEGRPWYRDPVGDSVLVLGVVGLGLGGVMLVSAHSASQDIGTAPDYATAIADRNTADSRGTLGSISMVAGGALVVTSIVWYATHASSSKTPALSGWIAPGTGGLALAGGF